MMGVLLRRRVIIQALMARVGVDLTKGRGEAGGGLLLGHRGPHELVQLLLELELKLVLVLVMVLGPHFVLFGIVHLYYRCPTEGWRWTEAAQGCATSRRTGTPSS